jgi:hypothetical protein
LSKDLSDFAIEEIKQNFAGVKYLIIDEFGMLGQKNLWHINNNLKLALSPRDKLDFGGLSVILVGDFNQLSPVKDCLLYKEPEVKNTIYTVLNEAKGLF